MKEYDRVVLIVEKEKYAKEGVHKGMNGIILDPRKIDGKWLVSFDQYGELPEIACLSVNEEDLEQFNKRLFKVKLITDKEQYIKKGICKGTIGWVCDERTIEGLRLVRFDVVGNNDEIDLPIYEKDLEVVEN